MRHTTKARASLLLRLGSLGGVLLLAAACTTADMSYHRDSPNIENAAINHPIGAVQMIATLTLEGNGGSRTLSTGEVENVYAFTDDFMRQGRGRLMITVSGGTGDESVSLARGKQAALRAIKFGLTKEEVLLRAETTGERETDIVVLTFETYVVQLPTCGDWSKENTHDPSNTLFSNSGCAAQYNAGLMIANPGDLAAPQANTAHDSARIDDITEKYRDGAVTLTPRDGAETVGFASIGGS